jgi:hypothetical protein
MISSSQLAIDPVSRKFANACYIFRIVIQDFFSIQLQTKAR